MNSSTGTSYNHRGYKSFNDSLITATTNNYSGYSGAGTTLTTTDVSNAVYMNASTLTSLTN